MKKLLQFFALTLISHFVMAQVPTNGLVSSYPFTGNSNDMSGNGNNLTPYNGPTLTTDRFGNANSAYLFDGVNDYFVGINPGPMGKKGRAIAFWAKTAANFNSNGYAVLHYGNPTTGGARFEIGLNSGCNGPYLDLGFGYVTKPYATTDNQWHFYVVNFDSTIAPGFNGVSFYVDAVLIGSAYCTAYNTSQIINTLNQDPINIGRFYSGIPRYFNGCLDDINVYNRPLTPGEITNMFNPCTGAPSSPVLISGNTNVCLGTSNVYSISPVSGATSYTWNAPGGWTGTSSSTTFTTTANISGGVISVAASNGCGTSAYTTLNINANPTPTVTLSTSGSSICIGNSVQLNVSGANSYSWNTGSSSTNISVSPTVNTTYTVTGTNSFGCIHKVVHTVTVSNNVAPTISASGPPGTSCPGQNVSLASNGASTYTWQPGNLNGFLVSVSPTITTTYTIYGTAGNGCSNLATYTQSVDICAGIGKSSTVTSEISLFPNPVPSQLTVSGLTKFSKLELYNSLGQIVISSEIKNETEELDLSDFSKGIYFLRLEGETGSVVKKIVKD